MNDLTHASFFSGVGGTDLGLERAGWHTVSFSEIDPYACAVLAERWPGVPNLGDIVALVRSDERSLLREDGATGEPAESREWHRAFLWSGGFPCQDLSVAGKRAGFAGERSVLAFAFLDLVERHRPPAILLENVPGLLSSHGGRDMARLLGAMAELGYGVAYRVLDAQQFGVPQRRRRVFILGLRSDPDDVDGRVAAERAAEVLSVGARCDRHPATGHQAGPGAAASATAGALLAREGKGVGHNYPDDHLISPPPDANGVRAADGLAGRAHDRELVGTLRVGPARIEDGGPGDTVPVVTQSLPTQRVGTDDNDAQGGFMTISSGVSDDPMLPLGLDRHRYRCCGNGVVAPVAEWLGLRLAEALA